jgi:hypothetical protein
MNKKVKRTGLVIVIIISLLALSFGRCVINLYSSEKDAGIIFKSIVLMTVEHKDEIKLNESTYLTKTKSNFVKVLMQNNGWNLEEQLGALYVYKNSEGKYKTVDTSLVWSSNYMIWNIGEVLQ